MPAGELVTAPVPVPVRVTVSVRCGTAANVAVTVLAASIVPRQAPVPLHAPPQPVNAEPAAALAVSVTGVPSGKSCAHAAPQSMPAGELVPAPAPGRFTVSVRGAFAVKVAVTLRAALIVTWHAPVPVQSPLQPAKAE